MYGKKRVIGIICECNPFHNGHKRLISYAKTKGDILIAVMSGNFVQRGEMAVYDKYKRTKDLLRSGIDIVIELPVEYVLSSAKYFALSSVAILDKLGIVDNIIFGSKINNTDKLREISTLDDKNVKAYLKEGLSYPKALEKCYGIKLSSNDILNVEYIRALKELNSKITPLCIKRKSDLPTATELRKKIKKKVDTDSLSDILSYILSTSTKDSLQNIYAMNNDTLNAILNTKNQNLSFTKRAKLLNTKNRTLANIKRTFLNIIFNITDADVKKNDYGKKVPYIRILGIKKEAMPLLKKIKTPYLMSYANSSYKDFESKFSKKLLDNPTLKTNIIASNIYYLFSGDKKMEASKPLIVL